MPLREAEAAVRCKRSFAYPVGGGRPCTARACVFLCIFVYREVCTAGGLFFFLSAKQVTCWRKRLEGEKKNERKGNLPERQSLIL